MVHCPHQQHRHTRRTEGQPGRARKKKKKVILSGRRTRGARERHSAQSFAVLLDEVWQRCATWLCVAVEHPSVQCLQLHTHHGLPQAALNTLPDDVPTYLNTAMGPSTTAAPRKFCSVCGSLSTYVCQTWQ